MLSHRAPLFSVGIAFAIGCLVGLEGWLTLAPALLICAACGLGWLGLSLQRRESGSLAVFYAFTASVGLAHTLLLSGTIAPDDLRRLPEDKTFPTTQWRGTVIQEPVAQLTTSTAHHALDRTSFVLRADAWRPTGGRFFDAPLEAPWQPARGDIRCTLLGPTQQLRCGDRLETAMELVPVPPSLSPGDLDYRAYEAEQGIYYQATIIAGHWRRIQSGGGDFWQDLSYRARDWAYARLQIGLEDDPRTADFLAGMLIGYRQQIPADIEQDFRRTGTLHVFAVSGQNIAELMVVAIVLLQLCGFVRWRWAWTLTPLVLLYCLLTGSPASAVRATVMVLAVLLAWRLGRPLHALACWSLAFLAMLVWNPSVLLDPGAQLSFGVVLGLILLGPPLSRLFYDPVAPDPFLPRDLLTHAQVREEAFWRRATLILGATIAATLVSEPITAVDFHQVTPISVLANLIVVPAAGLITVVGTLGVAVSLVSPLWAGWLNNANWLFAQLLIALVALLARQPAASLNVPDVRTLASPLPMFTVAPIQDSACLLVRTGHRSWLFNTGRQNPGPGTAAHLLQFYGINQLDGLVLAQLSVSDNGAAEEVVRDFHPLRLVVPGLRSHSPLEKQRPDLAALAGHPLETWQRGQSIALDANVSVDVLNPSGSAPLSHGPDRSLVLLFHAANRTLLWAGKIDGAGQADLLSAYPQLHADLLVLALDAEPATAWLQALRVQQWLQIPRRDRELNVSETGPPASTVCQPWPLDQTGAVEIHFQPGQGTGPELTLLHPWLSIPPAAKP